MRLVAIFALGLVAFATLPGCAPVSKSECQTGDWYDIGLRDGARGYGEERFLENAKACAKHGLTADRERWLDGRMHGLERYCTPRSGFEHGASNDSYAGVCQQFGEDRFLEAFNLGKQLADARARRARWDSEIGDIRDRLNRDDKLRQDEKDGKAPSDDDKKDRLSSSERTELGIRLGIAIVKRADAEKDCEELEARGREY